MRAEVISRETFVPSPGIGKGVMGGCFYTQNEGLRLMSTHVVMQRSDTVEVAYIRYSPDNGKTWEENYAWPMRFAAEGGSGRRHFWGGYLDPKTDRFISMWNEGVLPTDDPLEGMKQWALHYSVSADGGRTESVREQIVHEGNAYDEVHHLPGVTKGKNCVMLGDRGQVPLTRSDGVILIPVQSTPVGPDGGYHNPGLGFTYTDCMLLKGVWQADLRLSWTCSNRIVADPTRTTRGLIEPTIAELTNGSILMIMRASNDVAHEWPGHKWMSFSKDGGETWTNPEPWVYEDGSAFNSPSACSQLLPHSNGKLYWIGNICKQNPKGNRPRYPIVIGEVDRGTGLLWRESVTILDDRQPGEHERMTLSNFHSREDRATGHILTLLPRFFVNGDDIEHRFTADLTQITASIS
ncbi:MAG TPA: hypothetical protein DHW45_10530 [Candidatus Latescibacteria bacterium]|nr:hypothetical protein [Candidatus Latescibacterota bacterium]